MVRIHSLRPALSRRGTPYEHGARSAGTRRRGGFARSDRPCILLRAIDEERGRVNRQGADPVVAELVRNGVMAVTEEMKTNLMRTAYNMIIYEALDFTVGLFTAKGETVSIGLGLPMFIPRHGRDPEGEAGAFRTRRDRARGHPRDQRRLHHRKPPQPHHAQPADPPRRRTPRLRLLHGPLASISAARFRASRPTSIRKGCSCRRSSCKRRARWIATWSISSP